MPMPWKMRSSVSSSGAQAPMLAYEGSRPIIVVPMPMIIMVVTRADFRPIRSPKWPKMSAPIGLPR